VVDFVDIVLGFGLTNDKSDEEESELMWFRMTRSGLFSMGSDSESDKGGNSDELWFEGDGLRFAARVDDRVLASLATAMGSEMVGSDSAFMVFTAGFREMINDITLSSVSGNKCYDKTIMINVDQQ
jgi:hypothetical protein